MVWCTVVYTVYYCTSVIWLYTIQPHCIPRVSGSIPLEAISLVNCYCTVKMCSINWRNLHTEPLLDNGQLDNIQYDIYSTAMELIKYYRCLCLTWELSNNTSQYWAQSFLDSSSSVLRPTVLYRLIWFADSYKVWTIALYTIQSPWHSTLL